MSTETAMPVCEVCNRRPSVGVCCVPGMPVSAAYCSACLRANAHPWKYLVANAACCGGLGHMAAWYIDMVADTCAHLSKTMGQFNDDVEASMKDMP